VEVHVCERGAGSGQTLIVSRFSFLELGAEIHRAKGKAIAAMQVKQHLEHTIDVRSLLKTTRLGIQRNSSGVL